MGVQTLAPPLPQGSPGTKDQQSELPLSRALTGLSSASKGFQMFPRGSSWAIPPASSQHVGSSCPELQPELCQAHPVCLGHPQHRSSTWPCHSFPKLREFSWETRLAGPFPALSPQPAMLFSWQHQGSVQGGRGSGPPDWPLAEAAPPHGSCCSESFCPGDKNRNRVGRLGAVSPFTPHYGPHIHPRAAPQAHHTLTPTLRAPPSPPQAPT